MNLTSPSSFWRGCLEPCQSHYWPTLTAAWRSSWTKQGWFMILWWLSRVQIRCMPYVATTQEAGVMVSHQHPDNRGHYTNRGRGCSTNYRGRRGAVLSWRENQWPWSQSGRLSFHLAWCKKAPVPLSFRNFDLGPGLGTVTDSHQVLGSVQ